MFFLPFSGSMTQYKYTNANNGLCLDVFTTRRYMVTFTSVRKFCNRVFIRINIICLKYKPLTAGLCVD